MKVATTPEDQRAYMAQWRAATVALEQVKIEELQAMTDEEATAASQDLLALGPFPIPAERQSTSGLVEQQRIFRKWHSLRRTPRRNLSPVLSSPMPATLDHVAQDALVLPLEQRAELAYRLLMSIESAPESGAEEAWDAEIQARIASFDAGASPTISASKVFAGLREIAPDRSA